MPASQRRSRSYHVLLPPAIGERPLQGLPLASPSIGQANALGVQKQVLMLLSGSGVVLCLMNENGKCSQESVVLCDGAANASIAREGRRLAGGVVAGVQGQALR